MRLVLLRHAIAEDRYVFHMSSNGAPDSQRPLTQDGINKMKQSASGLYKLLDENVQRVASSPYLRAKQTAELFLEAIPQSERPELEISDLLTPGCSFHTLQYWLNNETGTMVLVGHEPDMSWLMQQFTRSHTQSVKFGKAGACMISFEGNPANSFGTLRWFMSPASLRKLAAA